MNVVDMILLHFLPLTFLFSYGLSNNQASPSICLSKTPPYYLHVFPICCSHLDLGLPLGCFFLRFKFKTISVLQILSFLKYVHAILFCFILIYFPVYLSLNSLKFSFIFSIPSFFLLHF